MAKKVMPLFYPGKTVYFLKTHVHRIDITGTHPDEARKGGLNYRRESIKGFFSFKVQ